jgi:hypothetical protein
LRGSPPPESPQAMSAVQAAARIKLVRFIDSLLVLPTGGRPAGFRTPEAGCDAFVVDLTQPLDAGLLHPRQYAAHTP